MKRQLGFAFALLLGLPGCLAHVQLGELPSRTASFAERERAYERLQPVVALETTYIPTANSSGVSLHSEISFMRLADGTQVEAPEDLVAAVYPESITAQQARLSASYRRASAWVRVGEVAQALVAGGFFVASMMHRSSTGSWPDVGLLATAAVLGLAAGVGETVRFYLSDVSADHGRRAFMSFDESLMQRLGLCGRGRDVLDCAGAAATSGLPPAAPVRPW